MKRLRFAIVGAGAIAGVHAASISELDNAVLTGVFDASQDAAARFAEKWGVRAYPEYSDLLADGDVDAVIICTPSGLRERFAVEAAAAKKHVVCEKPIEIRADRIDRMIRACEEHGVTLSGIFNNRYNDVYRRIKRAADEGEFGRLLVGDVYVKWYRSDEYYRNSGWRGTWAYDGGGALMNQSIHFIDLLQWIMGPVAEVKAFAGALLHPIEVEDTAAAAIRFESGALGIVEGTTAAVPGLSDRLEIHGEKGSVKVESGRITYWNLGGRGLPEEELEQLNRYVLGNASDPGALDYRMHKAQLGEIARDILEGRAPALDGRAARRSVDLILRIYESAGIGLKP